MMRIFSNFALTLSVAGLTIATTQMLSATAASAEDMYGAIATSDETGAWGYGYNYETRAEAEAAALEQCNQDDCQVEVWFANACGAVAKDGKTVAWGWAKTRAQAESKAISACGTESCQIEVWACTNR